MKRLVALMLAASMAAWGIAAGPAYGASATPVPDRQDIQFWPEYEDSNIVFLQTISFPKNTPLPIPVKMAVPDGAKVYWAGEITGGPAAQDITIKPSIVSKRDYQEVTFTLNRSRIAQVEAKLYGLKITGQKRVLAINWFQAYPARQTYFQVKAPTQSSGFKMSPAYKSADTSPENLRNYTSAPLRLPVGQKRVFRMVYQRSTTGPSATGPSVTQQPGQQQPGQTQGGLPGGQQAAPGATPGGAPATGNTVIYLLIALIAGGIAYTVYQRREAEWAEDYDDDEDAEWVEDYDDEETGDDDAEDDEGPGNDDAPPEDEDEMESVEGEYDEFDEFTEYRKSKKKKAG